MSHTLSHYSKPQLDALALLFEAGVKIWDTGGGSTVVKIMLSLYNGTRFQVDLTDLRRLDDRLLTAAMEVIHMDARRTYAEIHVVIAGLYGVETRVIGSIFEHWAYDLGMKGRCKKDQLPPRYRVELMGAF